MAATTYTHDWSVTSILTAPLRAIGRGMIRIAEANSRAQEVERLNRKSDDELAKIGLTRETIVAHVFRAHLYI